MSVDELAPPRGWFAVAFAHELRGGAAVTGTVNGREVVVFRTATGQLGVVDPTCPHLGAHLGVGGRVDGDALRCPFHGFGFDTAGRCTSTGYGTPPPAGLHVAAWPVVERAGVVLVWHDPAGGAPTWTVPPIDADGWSGWATRRRDLRGHPQETTENAADVGHFAVLHGYHDVATIEPLHTDGPTLRATYGMVRPFRRLGPLHRFVPLGIRVQFDVAAHGLGFSLVEARVPRFGVTTRQLVCATATERGQLALRIGTSVRAPWSDRGRVARLTGRAVAPLIARAALRSLAHDVGQDEPVWAHKDHLARPRLARGDGPIGRYRTWAAQFASDAASAGAVADVDG